MERSRQYWTVLLAVAIGLVGSVEFADAHRVNVFAWVEGDTVYVESKWPGGKPVTGGNVVVTDSQGIELLTGETNDQGDFSFKVPKRDDLTITLIAGMGHQATWKIAASDIQGVAAGGSAPTQAFQKPAVPKAEMSQTPAEQPVVASPAISTADLQQAMENALDKKLKPVIKMLADAQLTGPSMQDIFGGIGYILGLVGVAAYFQSRKTRS
jgi:nickel transport protein